MSESDDVAAAAMNLPKPTVRGSANPAIAFCLTLRDGDDIPAVLKFVKTAQDHAPVFMDDTGGAERLRCETIIRTDIPQGVRNGNWMRVFNPGGVPTGIDDFYIFEYLNCPWGSRSMVEVVLLDPADLGVPLELSYAIKAALVAGALDGRHAGWQIVIHPDPGVASIHKARAAQAPSRPPPSAALESSEVPDLLDHEADHQ